MTYLQFHLIFTLPLLAVLAFFTNRLRLQGKLPAMGLLALCLHVLVALIYTTPWDNYLVASGVWGYGEGRVAFTIGWVPFEEYLFFIIQTLIVGCNLLLLATRLKGRAHLSHPRRIRLAGAACWSLLAISGALAMGSESGRYYGLITAWAAPVIAFQWAFGGDLLLRRAKLYLTAILLPTVYLWIADALAIAAGIWWISADKTSGWHIFGLPLEEAIFFLLTNVLVVSGMMLFLDPAAKRRLAWFKGVTWWRGLLALWALAMVPVPLAPDFFLPLVYLSTSALALGVLGMLWQRLGSRALMVAATAFLFGLFVEVLGVKAGFPFGSYRYLSGGPTLFGVPLFVPLGWFAFASIALTLLPQRRARYFAPLALVAWDSGLDPLMTRQGVWAFDAGAYFGIPLSNFVGWFAAGWLLCWLLGRLEPRLQNLSLLESRVLYATQTLFIAVGLTMLGAPRPALAAFVIMVLTGGLGLYLLYSAPKAAQKGLEPS